MVEEIPRQNLGSAQKLAAAREVFADLGLRVTRPRLALAELLFGKGPRHVSAESLYDELNRSGAPGCISSVYRNLKDLSSAGLLKRVPIYGSTAWFDTQVDPHHHFYAEDEDRLIDVPTGEVSVGDLPPPPDGYEVVGVDVFLRVRRREPRGDA